MTNRKIVLLLPLLLLFPFTSEASVLNRVQGRDHFTELEVEQIKDTQILDKRIGVFIKAIERRLRVLTGTTIDTAKQQKKDAELYGELPSRKYWMRQLPISTMSALVMKRTP